MRYLSVCSGIEAATVAWHDLGWKPVGFSEIEPFPSAVLAHHYPNVTNFGDMTKYKEWNIEHPDILVGGTPCQSFSVAGLRKGLDDPRGNLALTYCGILDHFRPTWFVWENVPGVLSSSGGRDFGSFLGAVAELGYGFAYRVLDAQFFGVAQRRRRVFVVGYLGDWRPPAAVLFERESLRRDTAPRRKEREDVAGTIAARFGISRNNHEECVASTIQARMGQGGFDLETETPVITATVGSLCATTGQSISVQDAAQGHILPKTFDFQSSGSYGEAPVAATLSARDFKSAKDLVAQPMIVHGTQDPCVSDIAFAQGRNNGGENVVAQPIPFDTTQITSAYNYSKPKEGDPCHPLAAGAHPPAVASSMAVRRLTPVECERLQGFPDNYTNIPWRKKDESPDGPRYKALGNSMAVPVMQWIGDGISYVTERI